jgi:NADH-quinone oxidoreductase subunit I
VEVCPFEAIKMDNEFELSNTDRFGGLLFDKHQLARSNDYYRRIHPTEATEVDARLAAEKAKAKAAAEAKTKSAAVPTSPAPAKSPDPGSASAKAAPSTTT